MATSKVASGRRLRFWPVWGLIVLGVSLAASCNLNPQPEPPAEGIDQTAGRGNNGGSGGNGVGGSGAGFQDASTTPHLDAGEDFDAAIDAADGDPADAADASAGDASGDAADDAGLDADTPDGAPEAGDAADALDIEADEAG